ncbi:MAG: aminoacyl-histidine dipeptidase [Gemmatimonadota bacterium]
MSFVKDLEPRALWRHFDRILEIPRGSKEEDRMRDYVLEVADRHGLEHDVDAAGNVVVRKPAAAGHEDAPITILQSHLDMVNEKNSDVDHDFSRDPIQPEKDGEWLTARGTTLGSDNGIGVAAMLALLEADDVGHGPLELLFTIDEETGLTGAAQLEGSMLQGRQLVNLDTEEEDAVTVGCAGGGDTHITVGLQRTDAPAGTQAVALALKGLKGGHSGIDIPLQRGNAVKLLARIIQAGARGGTLHLAAFAGGDKHNAIPRESTAVVVLPEADVDRFEHRAGEEYAAIRAAYPVEPDMVLKLDGAEPPEHVLDPASSWKVVHLLQGLPHGVDTMSYDIPDLVETSTNMAKAVLDGDRLDVLMSTRSSIMSELEALRGRIRAIAQLAGADADEEQPYPGWKPDLESHVLAVLKEAFNEVKGKDPVVEAVHAGLETGIIGEKVPGMDMVSFGPQIEFPHSPDERVRIPSVATFYEILTRTLEKLGRGG